MSTVPAALPIDLREYVGDVVEILPIRAVDIPYSHPAYGSGSTPSLLIRIRRATDGAHATDRRGTINQRLVLATLTPDIGEGDWVRARVAENPRRSIILEPAE